MTPSDHSPASCLKPAMRIRGLLIRACYAFTILAVGFPVVARAVCWPYRLPDIVADLLPLCLLLAFSLLLTLGLLAKLPVQAGLFVLALLGTLTSSVLVCHFASLGPVPDWLATLRRGPFEKPRRFAPRPPIKAIGIYQFDPRFGYGHIPNSRGRHATDDFDVTYTIDDQGCRVTPAPESPRGTVLITGCSFTFGYGVEDEECFPAVLAREHWTEYKVRNRGVCGQGTAHAYLAVTDAMSAREEELPALVLYAMIPHHVKRNYLRRSYIGHLAEGSFLRGRSADPLRDRRGHPHFELEDGRLVPRGLAYLKEAVADSPCLRYPEFLLTEAFLTEMHQRSVDKHVPFFVVLLPENGEPEDEEAEIKIKAMLRRLQLPHLDLSDMPVETIPNDRHPSPASHRQFAKAICESSVGQSLVSE